MFKKQRNSVVWPIRSVMGPGRRVVKGKGPDAE